MKLKGKVEYKDFEGGVWVLATDDGRQFQLAGGDRKLKQDGRAVEVEGDADSEAMTAGMAGPLLNVRSYRFL